MAAMHDLIGLIDRAEPRVWLKGLHRFIPDVWGGVAFSNPLHAERIAAESKNGGLLAVYVTKSSDVAPIAQRGKVLGIFEIGMEHGPMDQFASPELTRQVETTPEWKGRWSFGLRALRAWQIIEEEWPLVSNLAHLSSPNNGMKAATQGLRVKREEALKLLDLDVFEIPVYGGPQDVFDDVAPLRQALRRKPAY